MLLLFCNHNIAFAETALGSASAEIMTQLLIAESTPMHFGTIMVDGNADVVSLGLSNDITISGSSSAIGGSALSAQFSATGTENAAIAISFADGNLSGTGMDMNVTNFVHSAGPSPQFDAGGELIFNVGADLHINNSQADGSYSGTYQVSINYQ